MTVADVCGDVKEPGCCKTTHGSGPAEGSPWKCVQKDDNQGPFADGSVKAKERERWSSSTAFIFAAIGSAIGLGNLWRFPVTCYKYGGGAFFLPYLMAFLFIGTPILILEVGLGQYYQGGSGLIFGTISPRFRLFGFSSAFVSLVLLSFYVPLISWFVRMLVYSFYSGDQGNVLWAEDKYLYTQSGAMSWVLPRVFGGNETGAPTSFDGVNFACLIFAWFSVWISVFFGVKVTGYLCYVTVVLPIIMVFILFVYGLTLPGSGFGITSYIGKWDLSVLISAPDVWSDATSQIFFSLGVTFGVMTAYGSYNDAKTNAARNCYCIAGFNSLYSIIAGFAVFAAIGHLSQIKVNAVLGTQLPEPSATLTSASSWDTAPMDYDYGLSFFEKQLDGEHVGKYVYNQTAYTAWFHETSAMFGGVSALTNDQLLEVVPIKAGGPTLAFGSYPIVLSQLPCPQFWNILFFLTLYFLGVDSAFALVEGVSAYLCDTELCKNVPRKMMTSMLCLFMLVMTLVYCTDAGLTMLDVVDYYLSFTLLIIGLVQVVLAGWVFRWEETVKVCGKVPARLLAASLFVPTTFGSIVGFSMAAPKGDQAAAIPTGAAIGLISGCLGFALTLYTQQFHGDMSLPYAERLEALLVGNTEFMRNYINREYLKDQQLEDKWYRGVPKYFWSFCIKYFCNICLIILTMNYLAAQYSAASAPVPHMAELPKFGRYGNFGAGWQFIGMFLAFIAAGSTVIGLIIPETWTRWSMKAEADPLRNGAREAIEDVLRLSSEDQGLYKREIRRRTDASV